MSHKKLVVVDEFELNRLLNIVTASSKIKSLEICRRPRRAQMHSIIHGGLGGAKSEILWEIGKHINQAPTLSFSKANLYGSIDKATGTHISPMLWDCRNSCLLIDDFVFNSRSGHHMEILHSLLPLLETPYIMKRVGYRCNEINEADDDLYLKIKDGTIRCKTRFSLIMNTMTDLRGKWADYIMAFASRCLVIPHYPAINDLKKLARDGTFYEFKDIKVKDNIKINSKDYNKVLEIVEASMKKPDSYLRTIGDCCRAFAVLRKHDEAIYKIIIRLHDK